MKFNIRITINSNNYEENGMGKYQFDTSNNIYLYVSENENIEDVFSDSKSIKKCLSDAIKLDKEMEIEETKFRKYLKGLLNKEDSFYKDIYSNSDTIYIYGTFKDIVKFITNNPSILNKHIVLENEFDLNDADYLIIKEHLSKYNNILYSISGNDKKVSYEELDKTFNIIDSLVEQVRCMDFSPIEQVMYLYDIVRDKVYTRETEEEGKEASRDLTSVLLGKKRVCVGYANIMCSVLNKLGFKNQVFNLDPTKGDKGHARNLVYVNDDKYDIDGYYFFDATWDSKKEEDSINYLFSYRFFANTLEQMTYYDRGRLYSSDYPCFNESKFYEAMDLIEDGNLSKVDFKIVKTINRLAQFIRGERIISSHYMLPDYVQKSLGVERKYSDDELIDELSLYLDLFNRNLSADTLLKVLCEVRKKEYYSEPDKYPFDVNSFYSAVINSNWIFDTPIGNLLESIFGVEASENLVGDARKHFSEFLELNDLRRQIEQIKVTRLLRSHLEKEKSKVKL